jgi:hypothetical protein
VTWWAWALVAVWAAPVAFICILLMVHYTTPSFKQSELPERNGAVMVLKMAIWPIYALRWLWWRWSIRKLTHLRQCLNCNGTGTFEIIHQYHLSPPEREVSKCETCNGRGTL